VAVNVLPGEPGGAAVVTVEPEIPYVKLINRVVTKKAGSRKVSVKIKSTAGGEEVTASGSIPAGDEGKTFYRRVGDPPVYCGNLIRETLGMLGMAVAGGVRTGAVPEKAVEIHIFKSERLAVLARDMNKSSNNFTAEQMIKAMGASRKTPGTFDEGLAAVSEFLERAGLGRGSYGMTNGSGLSHLSRFSSAQMVKILVYASSQFRWSPEFISSLSISAGDGTIRKRYKDTPAAGIVRAKTGTIDGVASLAGYLINASGDVVAFAIIINGFDPKRYREAADICDAAAVMLAET
jgi:D-alanyl-D-alanine carboxypeptidase/D-alanyl-D-alanine-endopeptidase (penicillin-binding protein 4)